MEVRLKLGASRAEKLCNNVNIYNDIPKVLNLNSSLPVRRMEGKHLLWTIDKQRKTHVKKIQSIETARIHEKQ